MRLPVLGSVLGPVLESVPGRHDLQRLVQEAASLVPRAMRLLDAAESLLAEATTLLARIEETRVDADALVGRTETTRERADKAVRDIDEPFQRLIRLLDALEPPLLRLQPTLDLLAESTDPREVEAAVAMIDQLPGLADRFTNDMLPLLHTLENVGPDMHELLMTIRELNELVGNIPGVGRLRKRMDSDD